MIADETCLVHVRLAESVAPATGSPLTMKIAQRMLVAALIAAITLPVAALAAKGERKKNRTDSAMPAFAAVDKNTDESISEEEFVAANSSLGVDGAKTRFGLLDKNHDGKLSKDEYAAGATERKKKKPKK
jgi:hypothetical protein